MSNPTQMPKRESPVPQAVPPKCPHCGHVLDNVGMFSWGGPPLQIFSIYCPNEDCRALLHAQIVPIVAQQQSPDEPPPGPRIHRVS